MFNIALYKKVKKKKKKCKMTIIINNKFYLCVKIFENFKWYALLRRIKNIKCVLKNKLFS
jgi:hypothetical protein